MSTDDRERELRDDIRLARQRLIVTANALAGSVKSSLDVMAPVRRHPVAGVAAALSGGLLVGGIGSLFAAGRKMRSERLARMAVPPTRSSMVTSLLWRFLPVLAPALVAFAQQRRGHGEDAPTPLGTSLRKR